MPQFLPPPIQNQPIQQPMQNESSCLVVRVTATQNDNAYDADSEDDEGSESDTGYFCASSDIHAEAADKNVETAFDLHDENQIIHVEQLEALIQDMPTSDTEEEFPLSFQIARRSGSDNDFRAQACAVCTQCNRTSKQKFQISCACHHDESPPKLVGVRSVNRHLGFG